MVLRVLNRKQFFMVTLRMYSREHMAVSDFANYELYLGDNDLNYLKFVSFNSGIFLKYFNIYREKKS